MHFICVFSDGIPSPLDPPEHLFRIRLVCVVLDTCGQYFDKGSSKKKLDCFLVYFQVWVRILLIASNYLYQNMMPCDLLE